MFFWVVLKQEETVYIEEDMKGGNDNRKLCLSMDMLNSERPMVYVMNYDTCMYDSDSCEDAKFIKKYCVAVSQSQGFLWNQDLFASQYQQNYKVEYDSFVDNVENIESIVNEANIYNNAQNTQNIFINRTRGRRKSENCISLLYESKNGTNLTSAVDEIEVDSNTPENMYLKSLVE